MDKTIAKLLHAEQPRARTNRIVPPPHFPTWQYGETRRVGKLPVWNKVPFVEKRQHRRAERGQQHLPGGRDQARLNLYKKATVSVQRYFTLREGRRGKRWPLSYYLLSRRFGHDPLQRIA
jgi:hypothetical protein